MITVAILFNGEPVMARSASNISERRRQTVHEYEVDDGTIIKHRRSDGYIGLAIKMLKTIKERPPAKPFAEVSEAEDRLGRWKEELNILAKAEQTPPWVSRRIFKLIT